jgi:DNA repair exonuclease SbcCD nuclease subunit
MSRYTVIGDPHLTHKSLDRAAQLFDLVEEIGLSTVWLGDFLDTKEVVRAKCLNALVEYLSRSKLKHIVLVGNHDWFNHDCQEHSLEALKLLQNVKVIDAPEVIDNMLFVPYIHDQVKLIKVLTRFQGLVSTLFVHLEVTQFDFGNGHVCTTGIPLEALKGFKRVISGHFHKFQQSGNLTYLGTPFSHSFGETNQTKFIGMYDTETNEFKLAETPFPQHITIEFDCDVLTDVDVNDGPMGTEHFYRFILKGSQANIDRFPKHHYEKLNIKWISRPTDDSSIVTSIDETASNEAQFSKWAIEIRKMDEETVKLGMEIMEACR